MAWRGSGATLSTLHQWSVPGLPLALCERQARGEWVPAAAGRQQLTAGRAARGGTRKLSSCHPLQKGSSDLLSWNLRYARWCPAPRPCSHSAAGRLYPQLSVRGSAPVSSLLGIPGSKGPPCSQGSPRRVCPIKLSSCAEASARKRNPTGRGNSCCWRWMSHGLLLSPSAEKFNFFFSFQGRKLS